MYLVFVRPILEYACTVWTNLRKSDINNLEKCNKRELRIILGVNIGTSDCFLYENTGLAILEHRREHLQLCTLFKVLKTGLPKDLYDVIPKWESNRQTQDPTKLPVIRTSSELHKNSFLPYIVQKWNKLPRLYREIDSIKRFKKNIKKDESNPLCYHPSKHTWSDFQGRRQCDVGLGHNLAIYEGRRLGDVGLGNDKSFGHQGGER